ncbi:7-cyano-7-deazaguanine synthase QueC [Caloranaerobacter azorensis]|uniref:7-cyano-7-deazaguanine synthase n=2 Tax=Caloranaerobacter azorensis TaxID=116090 RepID=A0A1M5RTY3_9FIRM|nr:7-cyano-7-deazaguanine synthase QueC [Caloranaerobacter azorensis]QIB26507.1 7-cyano-7-deazaguanine synthase QueC [Caloranaerobacter azorensis]SHH29704.1 preQ(0) biosynthesis protein QueC [Caloranaerobacter azorensis DSM 13643]
MKKAVILLSGGLDSTTCMGIAQNEGYELYPISFDYKQRHRKELEAAKKIAEYYNVKEHRIISLDNVGGSALTDKNIDVPEYKGDGEIPVTYVPARNILFLSYALGYAEVIGAEAIFIGVSSVDYSGYPDCRPEFIEAFQKVVDVGTAAGVKGKSIKIIAPLINLSKAETIKLGTKYGVPYHLTTSCYNGKEKACGVCDSCVLRLKGFAEAGIEDPIEYEK